MEGKLLLLACLFGVCFGAGQLLWQAGTDRSIYNDVVMTHEGTVSTTDFVAPPYMMATYEYQGRGQPIWQWIGENHGQNEAFYAAGIRQPSRPVLVDLIGVVYGEFNHTIVIRGFEAKNNRPVWQYNLFNAIGAFDDSHLMDVAEDGSFFALLYLDPVAAVSKLLVLDAQTGRLHTTYATETGGTHNPRRVDVNMDGRFVTFVDDRNVYVLDIDTRAVRGTVLTLPFSPYSHECGCNQDGNLFAAGRNNIQVYEWSFSARKWNLLWQTTASSWGTVDALHFGRMGLLFVGWTRADFKQLMFERYEVNNGSYAMWTYQTKEDAGQYRNHIDDVETDLNGEFIAVATWGDVQNINPQVYVFDSWRPTPAFTYFTAGSMYAIDVIHEADRTVVVSAAGKHTHIQDRTHLGGDTYCFKITRD